VSLFAAYLAEEDLNDDHEVVVPRHVRNAFRTSSGLPSFAAARRERIKARGRTHVAEVFSPPRMTTRARELNLTSAGSFDLETGWNCHFPDHRRFLWATLAREDPYAVMMSPECRMFSIMQNLNRARWDRQRWDMEMDLAVRQVHLCVEIADYQARKGRRFIIEHPLTATSWGLAAVRWLLEQPGVYVIDVDMCNFGLCDRDGHLHKKPTRIATNDPVVAAALQGCRCSRDHEHVSLEGSAPGGGGARTKLAQVYPAAFVDTILLAIRASRDEASGSLELGRLGDEPAKSDKAFWEDLVEDFKQEPATHSFVSRGATSEVADEEMDVDTAVEGEAEMEEASEQSIDLTLPKLTSAQRSLVERMHVNLGHPHRDQFVRILRAAKARPEVVKYAREEYECPDCAAHARARSSRRVAMPRSYSFNRVVGVDTFKVNFFGHQVNFVNVVCHGTNLQQVVYLGREYTADAAWRGFCSGWLRPFGAPEVLLSDGGPEFAGIFARRLEQAGTCHRVTDAESPWQNGRVERHEQWIQDLLVKALETKSITTEAELELMAYELTSQKNRYLHRGGYSPYQLVFGSNPRLPNDLLSDDGLGLVGISDTSPDAVISDSVAAEFARQEAIRKKARELLFAADASKKVAAAAASAKHRDRHFQRGQWVYVWRRATKAASQGKDLGLQRDRWVGPGLVALQDGHTVWVAMRSRLWKCSSEQVRLATHPEALGAELLDDVALEPVLRAAAQRGYSSGINVAREGPPPAEAWEAPTDHQVIDAVAPLPFSPVAAPAAPDLGLHGLLPPVPEENEADQEQEQVGSPRRGRQGSLETGTGGSTTPTHSETRRRAWSEAVEPSAESRSGSPAEEPDGGGTPPSDKRARHEEPALSTDPETASRRRALLDDVPESIVRARRLQLEEPTSPGVGLAPPPGLERPNGGARRDAEVADETSAGAAHPRPGRTPIENVATEPGYVRRMVEEIECEIEEAAPPGWSGSA